MNENNEDRKNNFVDSDDPALLAVKGQFESKEDAKNYVKNLAKAIVVVFQKHSTVKLRCVGAASLNNAIKAHIIASGEFNKKGVSLVLVPSFTIATFKGGFDRTAIVLEVTKK